MHADPAPVKRRFEYLLLGMTMWVAMSSRVANPRITPFDMFDGNDPGSKPSEKSETQRVLNPHLLPFFGGMTIEGLLQPGVRHVRTEGARPWDWIKTVNDQLAVLSTLIKYATGEQSKLRFKLDGMNGRRVDRDRDGSTNVLTPHGTARALRARRASRPPRPTACSSPKARECVIAAVVL